MTTKQRLKQHFRDKRSNEQSYIQKGEKYFNPVIKAQKEVSKEILESLNKNQENITNSLVPLTKNLERRIDQVEELHSLPYYNAPLEATEKFSQSTPKKETFTKDVDLDNGLNDTDKENLSLLGLDLPSDVFVSGTPIDALIKKVQGRHISVGKVISDKDKKGKKSSEAEKEIARSQKETLKKYLKRLDLIKTAKEQVFGDGLKINDLDNHDLAKILDQATNEKGNSKIGIKVLDELLKRCVIDSEYYNGVVMKHFSKRPRGRPRKKLNK